MDEEEGIQHGALCDDLLLWFFHEWGRMLSMVNEPRATAVWLKAIILTLMWCLETGDAQIEAEVVESQEVLPHDGLLIRKISLA